MLEYLDPPLHVLDKLESPAASGTVSIPRASHCVPLSIGLKIMFLWRFCIPLDNTVVLQLKVFVHQIQVPKGLELC